MANWQRNINLQPEWGKATSKEITSQALAEIIANKLKEVRPFHLKDYPGKELVVEGLNGDRAYLVQEFQTYAKRKRSNVKEFDKLMNELYDWGDTPLSEGSNPAKACWINTI